MEALLPRSVPQLHPEALVLDVDGLGDEVHSDCWLRRACSTCSLPVKLSKMKRFIMEVLPTDWSPSNTILHFTAGLLYIFSNFINLQNTTHLTLHMIPPLPLRAYPSPSEDTSVINWAGVHCIAVCDGMV